MPYQVIWERVTLCSKPFIPRTQKGRGVFQLSLFSRSTGFGGSPHCSPTCGSEHFFFFDTLLSVSYCPSLTSLALCLQLPRHSPSRVFTLAGPSTRRESCSPEISFSFRYLLKCHLSREISPPTLPISPPCFIFLLSTYHYGTHYML